MNAKSLVFGGDIRVQYDPDQKYPLKVEDHHELFEFTSSEAYDIYQMLDGFFGEVRPA